MTTPSGQISLADIQTEFGGANPIGLSEYYRGGTNVPATQGDGGFGLIPVGTAGTTISMLPFRNQTKNTTFVFNFVISANITTGFNLWDRAVAAGWNTTSPLQATITVNAGIYVTYVATPSTAFNASPPISSSWPAGSTLTVVNNGTIEGMGGDGGFGGSANGSTLTNGVAGGAGQVAFRTTLATTITNNGVIGGGGGGGGGGGSAWWSASDGKTTTVYVANGGGGGGARALGGGASAGALAGADVYVASAAGANGTLTSNGAGGASSTLPLTGGTGGAGGAGGTLGQPGSPGSAAGGAWTSISSPGGGGAAGAAIVGGSFITWLAFGTRSGNIDNPGTNSTGTTPTGVTSFGGAYSADNVGASGTTASIRFNTDGTINAVTNRSAFTDTANGDTWYAPTTAGIGASYWIRATTTAGQGPSTGSGVGTWLQLNAQRLWTWNSGAGASGVRQGTILLEISTNSSGSPVVTSGSYNMSAAHEP